MKIVVVGFGQAGCNIADEFYNLNRYSKSIFHRGIEIVTGAFAINSDTTDLSGLVHIPSNIYYRLHIGGGRTQGHGAGKDNAFGAKLMRESISVLDNVLNSRICEEADAILLMASAAGGTGSGAIGVATEVLKKKTNKPVYNILVLPFKHEELEDLTIKNTATCLRKLVKESEPDAIFLLDNEKFGRGELSVKKNYQKINQDMVMNFYDLFCAGEEEKAKYVGGKVVDAGDIIRSLEGPSVIGRGVSSLKTWLSIREYHFREGAKRENKIFAALEEAKNRLGLQELGVKFEDVGKLMWLICGPDKEITLKVEQEITRILKEDFPNAEIRHGNYPRRSKEVAITIIASKIMNSERMRNIFSEGINVVERIKEKEKEAKKKLQDLYRIADNLPEI